jgi:hypothetical protein
VTQLWSLARATRSIASALVGLAGVLGGCGDAEDAPAGRAEAGPAIEYRLVYEVGRDEGGLTFGAVGPGAFDDAGAFWTYDFMRAEILHLDVNGDLLDRKGRGGRGPGEFSELRRVGLTPDGMEVWAADHRLGRVTFFDLDSDGIRTVGQPEYYYAPPLTMQGPLVPLPDGAFAVLPPETVELPFQFPDTLVSQPIIRVDADGVVLDTLLAPPPLAIGGLRLHHVEGIGSTVRVMGEEPLFWASPRGMQVGAIDRLHGLEPGVLGTVHRARWLEGTWSRDTLVVPGNPVAGTREEVRQRLDNLGLSEGTDRDAIVREVEGKPLGIPPFLSTISNFHLMSDGTIWIGIQDVFRGPTRWIRRTEDGTDWVPVEFPASNIFRLLDASGQRVAAVLMDEFRVQSLAVFERVER